MRHGFTTGSCAAAASKAAAYMLLTGKLKEKITIETPKGLLFTSEVLDVDIRENWVRCGILKDGGDDPDVTTGAVIYSTVSLSCEKGFRIDGGKGVGRITRPGLDQPVGNAAINHVPREMIAKEVKQVCDVTGYQQGLDIVIDVPMGEEIAEKTFNPRLGIVGGISILGTSGVVEPMSAQALIDTIFVELRQKKSEGNTVAYVSPGNYGLDYMKETYNYDLDKSVKCSNFIGITIDKAVELGFEKMLLTGHIGKLIKVAGGIMNTHSKEADCRMEIFCSSAIRQGATRDQAFDILQAVTTEDAIARVWEDKPLVEKIMEDLIDKIHFYLNKRGNGKIQIECIMYSNDYGELGKTPGAVELLNMNL